MVMQAAAAAAVQWTRGSCGNESGHSRVDLQLRMLLWGDGFQQSGSPPAVTAEVGVEKIMAVKVNEKLQIVLDSGHGQVFRKTKKLTP